MKQYRYSFFAGILIGLGLLAWAHHGLESISFGPRGDEQKFDRKTWLESSGDRIEMVEDVKIYILRKGMSKAEVIRKLGLPNRSGHHESYYRPSSKIVSYDLGYVYLDPCTLDLTFDEDNKLISFSQNCA